MLYNSYVFTPKELEKWGQAKQGAFIKGGLGTDWKL